MVGTRRHRAQARGPPRKRGGQSARVHPRGRDPKWDFPLGSRNNSFRPLYNNSLRGGSRDLSSTELGRFAHNRKLDRRTRVPVLLIFHFVCVLASYLALMETYAVCSHLEGSLTLSIFISQPSKLCAL